MTKSPSDRELMIQVGRRQDRGAFEELARRWDGRVLAFLAKSRGDLDAAEDLRQEAFVRLWRHGGRYNPRFAFSTWLFRIVGNALRSWRAAEGRRGAAVVREVETAQPGDVAPNPREALARKESAGRVREALARLTVEERELLLLRFDLDFTYRQIGQILEAPETTVKSRLYKLLGQLRRELSGSGVAERTM